MWPGPEYFASIVPSVGRPVLHPTLFVASHAPLWQVDEGFVPEPRKDADKDGITSVKATEPEPASADAASSKRENMSRRQSKRDMASPAASPAAATARSVSVKISKD